jgi:hypothetical protein
MSPKDSGVRAEINATYDAYNCQTDAANQCNGDPVVCSSLDAGFDLVRTIPPLKLNLSASGCPSEKRPPGFCRLLLHANVLPRGTVCRDEAAALQQTCQCVRRSIPRHERKHCTCADLSC